MSFIVVLIRTLSERQDDRGVKLNFFIIKRILIFWKKQIPPFECFHPLEFHTLTQNIEPPGAVSENGITVKYCSPAAFNSVVKP